jgi:hypothetical protein
MCFSQVSSPRGVCVRPAFASSNLSASAQDHQAASRGAVICRDVKSATAPVFIVKYSGSNYCPNARCIIILSDGYLAHFPRALRRHGPLKQVQSFIDHDS